MTPHIVLKVHTDYVTLSLKWPGPPTSINLTWNRSGVKATYSRDISKELVKCLLPLVAWGPHTLSEGPAMFLKEWVGLVQEKADRSHSPEMLLAQLVRLPRPSVAQGRAVRRLTTALDRNIGYADSATRRGFRKPA